MAKQLLSFKERLEDNSGKKFEFKINHNRSTMLSVRWEPDRTLISMHEMFLSAPKNVMDDLACYFKREYKDISPAIRAYIEEAYKKLDYSHTVNTQKLEVEGLTYHLKSIYNQLNDEYFDGRLKLFITWFGKRQQKNRSRINFGLYYDPLKLIKISRLLDSPYFPEYVVRFVIYHEMLHHVCPSYYDEQGIHRIHSKEFKALEKKFSHYKEAQAWIKNNTDELFAKL
jgi:hypothetical protein